MDKIYPYVSVQAYQAEVMFRKVQTHTVGTRYPFKDQLVLTAENTLRHPENDIFTYSQRIDVVVKCENQIEAKKLNGLLRDYFAKDLMLPLHVGVFQKPYLKENQKARKYFAYATISAKDLIEALPKYEKDKALKYVLGVSLNSDFVSNGFDLTYSINKFTLEHMFLSGDRAKEAGLNEDMYRLSLYTVSIVEQDEDSMNEELINFEILGESESEIIALAKKLTEMQNNGVVFTCKGRFPKLEKDFYRIKLDKTAGELLESLAQKDIQKAS